MRAGALRDRVTVERQADGVTTGAVDDMGNPTAGGGSTWAKLADLWANVRVTPGREAIAAGRLEATATATVRMRAQGQALEIRAGDRLTFRGEVWAIRNRPVVQGNRREFVEFTCEAGVAT